MNWNNLVFPSWFWSKYTFHAHTFSLLNCMSQGCWRKITIDDSLPFDENNNLLLPATTNQSELWPMLLAKAILKLASTE